VRTTDLNAIWHVMNPTPNMIGAAVIHVECQCDAGSGHVATMHKASKPYVARGLPRHRRRCRCPRDAFGQLPVLDLYTSLWPFSQLCARRQRLFINAKVIIFRSISEEPATATISRRVRATTGKGTAAFKRLQMVSFVLQGQRCPSLAAEACPRCVQSWASSHADVYMSRVLQHPGRHATVCFLIHLNTPCSL
jgi:hypothetical protein